MKSQDIKRFEIETRPEDIVNRMMGTSLLGTSGFPWASPTIPPDPHVTPLLPFHHRPLRSNYCSFFKNHDQHLLCRKETVSSVSTCLFWIHDGDFPWNFKSVLSKTPSIESRKLTYILVNIFIMEKCNEYIIK